MNPLLELINYGQSYWLDNLTRGKIKSGELKRRVEKEGLRGITSNPAIFNKAISNSSDYDKEIEKLVKKNFTVEEIYEKLTVGDVQNACDKLRPVYDKSDGVDGFVSLEVSPYLAHDTEGTKEEVRRLFKAVDRPNCFIKIPGTIEGIPAIEEMLYEGINVNITLLFSIKSYEDVAEAYVKAMERRLKEGKDLKHVRSVASFFLSRIDVLVDQLLGHLIVPSETGNRGVRPEHLLGQAGIASAKIAYKRFKEIFSGSRWEKLEKAGAKVQRPLWASTSTKDPLYSDVRYVDSLIAQDTVNTLPDATIDAFADHGTIKENAIEDDLEEAEKMFVKLKRVGVDINFVTTQLVNEGVQKFIDPYNSLMKTITEQRDKVLKGGAAEQEIGYGEAESKVKDSFDSLIEKQYVSRLYAKDPYIWKSDTETANKIRNRLGWLGINDFIDRVDDIEKFVREVKDEGIKYVVLLGMGGSSLCPEVSRETFGTKRGYPELHVLDNTSPGAVTKIERAIEIDKTLFIVASKSGTTTETLSFYHYFYDKIKKRAITEPGKYFTAITDDGTPLAKEAEKMKFRKTFINPQDFGGRYSALSYFGLVPMALIGVDIKQLLELAYEMKLSSGPAVPPDKNPAVKLGALMGIYHKLGRDKATFILSNSVGAFGYWVEQLIAESTGKEGTGILPVEGEEPGRPQDYSNDRLFIYIHSSNDEREKDEKKLEKLEKAGHPVVRINLSDKKALGAEYFGWEVATATAGRILGINPFDEPNVSESKKNTADLLKEWKKNKRFNTGRARVKNKEIEVYCEKETNNMVKGGKMVDSFVRRFVQLAEAPDYIALLAYTDKTAGRDKILQAIRKKLRNTQKTAVTVGYGPRYLHSTGQLHKGGPNRGVYLMITSDNDELEIPGEEYGFATLQFAQALGDYRSLADKNRRVIRIHFKNMDDGLKKLNGMIK